MSVQTFSNPQPTPGGGPGIASLANNTMPNWADTAKTVSLTGGNGVKKIVNGIATDKFSLLNQFKNDRASADQSRYRDTVDILRAVGLITTKNPSRASVEKAYNAYLSDFYSATETNFSNYNAKRAETAFAAGIGTRSSVSRTVSSPEELTSFVLTAFRDYAGIAPNDVELKTAVKQLQKLEISGASRTTTTKDAAGNSVSTTSGGVTQADKEGIVLGLISKYITAEGIDNIGGQIATNIAAVRKYANDFGVVFPDAQIRQYGVEALGKTGIDTALNTIKTIAKVSYPGIAQFIDAGITVKDVASQYLAKKAQILEQPLETISIFDRDITNAISGSQGLMSLGDFENAMRKKPEWQFTKNANETAANFTTDILSRFGMI